MKLLDDNGQIINVDSSRDIIEHFGIKGMKWGHRRSLKNELRKWIDINGGKKSNISKDVKRESYSHSKLGTLFKSNRSLQYRIGRLKEIHKVGKNAEKEFNNIRLTKREKDRIKKISKKDPIDGLIEREEIRSAKENQIMERAERNARKTKLKY